MNIFKRLFGFFRKRPEIEYKLHKFRVITHDLRGTIEEIDITKDQFKEFKDKIKRK